MSAQYYLGIDQGSTGTTAILFDSTWHVASRGYSNIHLFYPRDGWVEHDAEEVWQSVQRAVAQALRAPAIRPDQIRSIGLNHEGETVVIWDAKTGRPLCRSIVWQDRRTARYADAMADQYNFLVRKKTGLMIDSYFSATKLKWMLDHVENAREYLRQGRLLAGTMDTWIVWRMTGGKTHITDASTASRTMLFDVTEGNWCPELVDLFDLDLSILPTISDSTISGVQTDPESFQGIRAPLSGVLVDQQAALLGQACVTPGSVKTTYGTGCFMLMNTGHAMALSKNGLLPTVAWRLHGKTTYALDGGVYITGAAVKWLQEGLEVVASPADTEQLALSVPDNGGVYFVPAFTGLAAPHWDSYARGMMIGITGGTQRAHVVRATLESTAYQVRDVLDVMRRESGVSVPVMRCNGRATANTFLMQFQADILGIPLEIPEIEATTALGSAFLGSIGLGDYGGVEDLSQIWRCARCYEPRMSADQRGSLLYHWHRAIERAKYWSED
ncbi:glycerol kinase [Oscillibacter valericigenes Sjm18-20]|nr:glycerol kinase [Oscillibacter valericigenes Sjm18-20]